MYSIYPFIFWSLYDITIKTSYKTTMVGSVTLVSMQLLFFLILQTSTFNVTRRVNLRDARTVKKRIYTASFPRSSSISGIFAILFSCKVCWDLAIVLATFTGDTFFVRDSIVRQDINSTTDPLHLYTKLIITSSIG